MRVLVVSYTIPGILLFLWLVIPASVAAYRVTVYEETLPYQVLSVTNPTESQFIVGELDGYPEMIEFEFSEASPLVVSLYALPDNSAPLFSGIAVSVLVPRGVAEVTRLKATDAAWELVTEPLSRLSFKAGPTMNETVASGTYRVEVSTPENYGKYLLLLGTAASEAPYLERWRAVNALYEFAGVSKFGLLWSPLVYYPVGIIVLIVGLALTVWRTRSLLPFIKRHE